MNGELDVYLFSDKNVDGNINKSFCLFLKEKEKKKEKKKKRKKKEKKEKKGRKHPQSVLLLTLCG